MRSEAISSFITFLFIYGMKIVLAQDIPQAHIERPRGCQQGLVKRTLRNDQPTAISGPHFLPNAALNDPVSIQNSFPQPRVSSKRSSLAHSQEGENSMTETTSVDLRSSNVSHRTTGTTIIGDDPAATNNAAPKGIRVSRTDKTGKNSETAFTDMGTTSKQRPAFVSLVTASTRPALSTIPTSPRDSLVGDVDAGVHKFVGGSTSSSMSWNVSAVTPSTDPLVKVLNTSGSYARATSTAFLLGSLNSGLDSLLGSPTSEPDSARLTKVSYPSNQTASCSNSSNCKFLGQIMTSSESEFFDPLGLTDKASTGSSTSDTSRSSSTAFSLSNAPDALLASATLLLSLTTSPIETSVSSGMLDKDPSGVGSLPSTGFPEASFTALTMTASMLDGNVLFSKSILPTPALKLGDSATAFFLTPTATSAAIPIPKFFNSGYSPIASTSVNSPGTGFGISTYFSTASASLQGITASVSKSDSPTTSVFLHGSTSDVNLTKLRVNTEAFQSKLVTPINSDDNDWMPSTLLLLPSVPAIESSASGLAEKPKETPIPGSIIPSDEVTEVPSDSILLQLGFDSQLPWQFVATTPLSSSQIFNYTPQAIENALPTHFAKDIPVMFALQPYFNWQTVGYNATLAIFYFPRDTVNTLRSLKVNPNSALYNQTNKSIKSLMAMVDPTIPLEFSGNYPIGDSNSTVGSGGSGSGRNSGPVSGSINSDGSASNFKINTSSIGVGIGAVAGAGAYGVGMLWVSRHYRRRKRFHQRSGSTVNHMGQGDSISSRRVHSQGSRGNARSQNISAPKMAENSLGWD